MLIEGNFAGIYVFRDFLIINIHKHVSDDANNAAIIN